MTQSEKRWAQGTPARGKSTATRALRWGRKSDKDCSKADDEDDVMRWRTRIPRTAVKDGNLDIDIRARKWKKDLVL